MKVLIQLISKINPGKCVLQTEKQTDGSLILSLYQNHCVHLNIQ